MKANFIPVFTVIEFLNKVLDLHTEYKGAMLLMLRSNIFRVKVCFAA